MHRPLTLHGVTKRYGQGTPVIANLRPAGEFLMEDFYDAGGLRAMLAQMTDLLNTNCRTVSGVTLGDQLDGAEVIDDEVIRPRDNPVAEAGGFGGS